MRGALVMVGLAACGSHAASHGDASSGDAPNIAGRFPLAVSADGRSVVQHDGTPLLFHGEAAWSLIAEPTSDQAEQYLTDRAQRGVVTILVNLIEHKFCDHPPDDAAGDAPFTTPDDFTSENEAYFAHADDIIDRAAAHGIAVMLFPSYLGYQGGDEGWYAAMSALTPAQCTQYGTYVGQRYANRTNIIWMWGGDYTPPSGSAGETCMKAIADAIRAAAPGALASAHWTQESTSRDEPLFAPLVDLVGVYTYNPIPPLCATARAGSPARPSYLLETTYENEHSAPVSAIRAQQWWAMLACGAGEISGNNPIWLFGSGWPQQLGSPLSKDQQQLAAIVGPMHWPAMAPDATLVTAGSGSGNQAVIATRTTDGTQALVYLPPGAASSITLDLSHMAGATTATWYDPTTGAMQAAGSGLTGSQTLQPPGKNAAGDGDWLLALIAP
ncbi:MAG TPA: DUF4038 domain-containing protein [Kofleriaceae bacterium]|nr:DUF4038 domain-containing protein [Kofleriaceae bacterium]